MTLWFTPLEPRIKAAVVSAYFNERTRKLNTESELAATTALTLPRTNSINTIE